MLELNPLKYEDMDCLYDWLNQPHMYPYYMKNHPSRADVLVKFKPRINLEGKTKCYIASVENQNFGYIQWYLNYDYLNYGVSLLGKEKGVSLDYFIGNIRFLRKNLGSKMLSKIICLVVPLLDNDNRIFYIEHDKENVLAIKCTKKSGFIEKKEYIKEDKAFLLFERDERV
jgi:hypothetical protein